MRLDVYLFEKGLAHSRTDAKALITEERIFVDGKLVTKPSYNVEDGAKVSVKEGGVRYVSRGGIKLEAALSEFSVDPSGRACLDVGSSSGGFTDCLLKHGAARIIAVDSGRDQLAESLRCDGRIFLMEGCNARYLTPDMLPFVPSLAVMDVSFISATYIIPAVYNCLAEGGEFISLIKPQFEVGRGGVGKGGIVKDDKKRTEAVKKVTDFAIQTGFDVVGTIRSPIEGGDGNIEFLAHFKKKRREG